MKSFSLTYNGYWIEPIFGDVPTYSGVYTFMECKYNENTNTFSLIRILYIGQANNIRARVLDHDKLAVMKRSLSYGNKLCINCAPVVNSDKDRVEAALVYKHQPPFNDNLKYHFNYDATTINNSGEYTMLKQNFTIFPIGIGLGYI